MAQSASGSTGRRELHFHCFNCMRSELDRIVAAHAADPASLRLAGNWTAAQNFHHLSEMMKRSIDGFDFKAPWLIRTLGPAMRRFALSRPRIPAGLPLLGKAKVMLPPEDSSFDEAITALRQQIGRVENEPTSTPHPVFGAMTQQDWTTFHLRHAELHLGFIHYS